MINFTQKRNNMNENEIIGYSDTVVILGKFSYTIPKKYELGDKDE